MAAPAVMKRSFPGILLFPIVASGLLSANADARSGARHGSAAPAALLETSPSLAPFQHVRFCLRYPADCGSNLMEDERINLTGENSELLDRVNRGVNAAIAPVLKSYGTNLQDGWAIAPAAGDCNDYAVTKRHVLIQSGLPAKALRLAMVKTASGGGHLVLLVATTKGDLVLDNLTEAIRSWQGTDYHWLKIQSKRDARLWYEIKPSAAFASQADRRLRLARGQ
jgi:predicted transglutaminase-like cysteine proteinase